MNGKRLRTLVGWLMLIAGFVGAQGFLNRDLADGVPPPIRGVTPDGASYAGMAATGRPSVIYFWASWCGICRAMQGTIRELARDVPLVTVALQSGNAAEVREYMAREGFAVPVVLDEDGAIGRRFGIRGVPALFVLGPDGTIRHATLGYTSALGLRVRLWLAGL